MKRLSQTIFMFSCMVGLVLGQTRTTLGANEQGTKGYIARFTSRYSIGNSSLFQNPNSDIGVGTNAPGARLDVLSNFPGGGPTVVVENADPAGDDAIDFHSGTAFAGNLGMITTEQPTRFFILQRSDFPAMPLTLAENGGNVGIGISNPTNILTVRQGAGPALADGWVTYSSRKWKTNIRPLNGALDKVSQLQGVTFNWKSSGKHDIGLIAEEVAYVVPELVAFDDSSKEAKGVDYSRLTTLLVEAIKEQQAEIFELRGRVENLTGQAFRSDPSTSSTDGK